MLNHIQEKHCPHCGSPMKRIEVAERTHANGTRQESLHFHCGYGLEYSPNYRLVLPLGECTKSEEYSSKMRILKQESIAILEFIDQNVTSKSLRERIIREINYLGL